jgi:hypothetical protein
LRSEWTISNDSEAKIGSIHDQLGVPLRSIPEDYGDLIKVLNLVKKDIRKDLVRQHGTTGFWEDEIGVSGKDYCS